MELIRKWNPKSAPYITIPNGPKVLRLVALIKDDVWTHYACFFDSWTGKIYIESLRAKHSGNWDYTDFWQIEDDKEWHALIAFLSLDGIEVIQQVESKFEKGMSEMAFHENLYKVPRTEYGVDSNGSRIIMPDTDTSILDSPCAWKE